MAETLLLASARATVAEPSLADQEVHELSLNPDGRLRVAGKPAIFPNVVGNVTTQGTAIANLVAVDVTDASNVVVGLKNTGAVPMAAGVFAFEASINSTDGVNGDWVAVQMARSNSNTIESARAASSLAAGTAELYTWRASINGYRWFRVRCTTTVTATAVATWTIGRGAYSTEPVPQVQTHAVTGSGSFTITPAAGTTYSLVTAATTNAAVVKATAGQLMEITIFNSTAAIIYVRLFNKATAPVPGTDVPMITIPVPVNGLVALEFGTIGKRFASGIGIAVTAAAGNLDATVVTVGALINATYI